MSQPASQPTFALHQQLTHMAAHVAALIKAACGHASTTQQLLVVPAHDSHHTLLTSCFGCRPVHHAATITACVTLVVSLYLHHSLPA